jgi:urease accessory protein
MAAAGDNPVRSLRTGSAVDRRLEVDLAEDAWFLGVEALVFGRAAMGEAVGQASLRDLIRVRRGGRLVWQDAVRLEGEVAATLRRKATANGARAVATIVHVARGAETKLDAVREGLASATDLPAPSCKTGEGRGQTAAASAWNGMLIARILAPDSATLRSSVAAVLSVLRGDRPLPRVWLC